MEIKTKCGICGFEFTHNGYVEENIFVLPYTDGAKYYYDLWHFDIQHCPKCGYCSKNVSKSYNKKIVHDSQYLEIDNHELIKELNDARPNRIDKYLKAAHYYDSVGDVLNNVKCLLQAGDYVYAELMYWDEYILDDSDNVNMRISKSLYNDIQVFAERLINSALNKLDDYVRSNPNDIDAMLLLAGSLSDGDKMQVMKAVKILTNLNHKNLSDGQRKALDFLLESIN